MARKKGGLLLSAAFVAIAMSPMAARAQSAGADTQVSVSIPAQGLSDALRQLAAASGLQLVYDTRITDGKTSPGVSGTMSSRAALAQLLAGSGLSFQFSGDRSVIITANAGAGGGTGADDGVRAVGVVSVEGVSGNMPFGEMASVVNGTNGSRDVQATEGTGSYTTGAASIVSKIPVSLKDTPQTVSVITSQRIADQNLINVRDILQAMPGITTTPGTSNEEFEIFSRGFRVTTYSYDGGAPLTYDNNLRPMLNMAEFDSLQLARGATGLFGGYGDPGGMVNLVRKKPLDHEQFLFEQDIGSWSNFRSVADYTGPVTKDKSLRGRVVFSHQSREYYYDVAKTEKTGLYGVFEYDLTPKTLVTFGTSINRENSTLNLSGLPRYSNGAEIDWPVSTCLCVPWSREKGTKNSIFASISHQISGNWFTKLNAMYDYQNQDGKYVSVIASSIPQGATSGRGTLSGQRSTNPARQTAIDYTINGKFSLLGREHSIAVGANYQYVNRDGGFTSYFSSVRVPNIFAFDPSAYPEQFPTAKNYSAPYLRSEAYGIYGNLTLQLLDNLRASIGMRYSETILNARFVYVNFDNSITTQIVPDLKDRSHSRPNFGVNFDITKNLTIYGSHQNIYKPQVFARNALKGAVVPPVTGTNDELGAKWQSPNKKLNASLAGFRITQNGFLGVNQVGAADPQILDTKGQGIELDLNGEILPGWQVSANYTFNDITYKQSSFFSTTITERLKTAYAPRHLGKVWTTYRGAAGGPLAGVILGGGLYIQSKSFQSTTICPFNPATGKFDCVPLEFTTKPYATFSLKGGYQLTPNIEMSVNVENLTNYKTYIASNQEQIGGYNYYLPPRSVMATTRFKW